MTDNDHDGARLRPLSRREERKITKSLRMYQNYLVQKNVRFLMRVTDVSYEWCFKDMIICLK